MKQKNCIWIGGLAGLLCACSADEPAVTGVGEGQPVAIGVATTPHEDVAVTRGPYSETVPTPTHSLSTYVWASTTSGSYTHNTSQNGSQGASYVVGKHAFVNFYSNYTLLDKEGERGLLFPINGKLTPDVYFVGLAPATNTGNVNADLWQYNEGTKKASFTFHGYEDAMFAPEVSGHYSGDIPVLHYYHLLTHLRFVIKCEGDTQDERDEVSYAWGRLQRIRLTKQDKGADSPKNQVSIDVSRGASNLTQVEMRTEFSSDATYLPLYETGSNNTYFPQDPDASGYADEALTGAKWRELPTAADGEEMAYVLCAPVTATYLSAGELTDEYTLTLDTEHRKDVVVGIDLKSGRNSYFSGSTMGCEFVVTLTFRFGKVVASALKMYDWSQEGGQTMQQITDN